MPNADDERLGQLLRKMRRQAGLTQEQLASLANVTVRDIVAAEAGRLGLVRVERARRMFVHAGGSLRLTAWFNGAVADRLLDEAHAALVEATAALLRRRGWLVIPELSFSEYGERGSIDLFAGYEPTHTVVVCEMKTDFGSLEQMNRSLDTKVRLAPRLAARVFGWSARNVGRLLVIPSEDRLRRIIERHEATMSALYPGRSAEIRSWLRDPDSPMSAIWFVSNLRNAQTKTR